MLYWDNEFLCCSEKKKKKKMIGSFYSGLGSVSKFYAKTGLQQDSPNYGGNSASNWG